MMPAPEAVVVRYDGELDEYVYSDGTRIGRPDPRYKEAYLSEQRAKQDARLAALRNVINELDACENLWRDQIMALLNQRYK